MQNVQMKKLKSFMHNLGAQSMTVLLQSTPREDLWMPILCSKASPSAAKKEAWVEHTLKHGSALAHYCKIKHEN